MNKFKKVGKFNKNVKKVHLMCLSVVCVKINIKNDLCA